eukprot:8292020-Alexandrium_andersonii.AAC.1
MSPICKPVWRIQADPQGRRLRARTRQTQASSRNLKSQFYDSLGACCAACLGACQDHVARGLRGLLPVVV